ncbi:MAG TPA: hypothetical protein DIW51_09070 [Rhodospirillaceae bacterium]|nr:hypothetical protein [Magnetovibrio sp.]HCS70104.1 hypothetical protein [Rhodospirillaceae bacterium]|tara:strand:+ start:116 stop:634 length:519 start_codon:yes stop_codon:yes gene_type:complete
MTDTHGHDARAIANFILDYSDNHARPVTHLWLQKAIFIAHGWTLVLLQKPLVRDPIEAWQYGPVIRSVFRSFSELGERQILGVRAQKLDLMSGGFETVNYDFDKQEQKLIKNVFDSHKNYTGIQLMHITHKEGAPWREIWDSAKNKSNPGMRIPNDLILKYYNNTVDGFSKI